MMHSPLVAPAASRTPGTAQPRHGPPYVLLTAHQMGVRHEVVVAVVVAAMVVVTVVVVVPVVVVVVVVVVAGHQHTTCWAHWGHITSTPDP